jgi:nucleotide-binding universal stress UspA family protein
MLALYCYDGSADAGNAIERSAPLLRGHDALVLCVFDSMLAVQAGDFPYPDMLPLEDVERVDDAARQRSLEIAAAGCDLLRAKGCDAQPAAVESVGAVWRTILEEADARDAAVIVLGSRGLTGVRSLVLGSVSHGVVNHSHRPVLVIPSLGDSSDTPRSA